MGVRVSALVSQAGHSSKKQGFMEPKVPNELSTVDPDAETLLYETRHAELSETSEDRAEIAGMSRQQLIENFQYIVRNHLIYYPVAYRFNQQIGEGRQGVVFEAERQGSRGCITKHAVKIFDPGIYSGVKSYWTDMGRIATQVSRLHSARSPNLADCDIYEETNGIGYIQMEMIEGMNLRAFLERCKKKFLNGDWHSSRSDRRVRTVLNIYDGKLCIQPGVAIYVMRQMLAGLESLNAAQYLHCDIKPLNAMIDPLGYVKLIDFGRAVMINETGNPLVGTPLYMAPEIHERKPATIQSDIYAVGLVGLELLRGQRLNDKSNITEKELLDLKLNLSSRLESLLPPYVRVNQQLVTILKRFLDPDPKKRFADAQSAESGSLGLATVHKQLTQMEIDSDYRRDLASLLSNLETDPLQTKI
jgi:serine/threonine protein kinase